MPSLSPLASPDKGLPSLNELFPEDLFRGSFAPLPLARTDSAARTSFPSPHSPTADVLPAPREPRRSPIPIPTRLYPHPPQSTQQHVRSWRPPPGHDLDPERPLDLHRDSHTPRSTRHEPLGAKPTAHPRSATATYPLAGPSSAPAYPPRLASGHPSPSPTHVPHTAARSTQSTADELVSALTRSRAPHAAPLERHESTSGLTMAPRTHGRTSSRGAGPRDPPRYLPYVSGSSAAPALTPTHAPYYPHAHANRPGPSTAGAANGAGGPGKPRLPESNPVQEAKVERPSALAPAPAPGAPARGKATATDDSERRHCCPHCNKRFNRPSSLAIHVNTHTGEKPFTCEFPGCNRKFNVNSNMRRHYRNHLTARRRDVVARMVQPSSLSPPSPSPSAVPQGRPGSSRRAHMQDTAVQQPRSGSFPASISGSRSPSVSRSSSYSPSPVSSRSPSPLPSPMSAVTSPFPPTPRSLPNTSFRTASPARYGSQPQLQPYYQHQSHSQPPFTAYHPSARGGSRSFAAEKVPERDVDEVMRAPSPPWSASEYDADELEGPGHPSAQAESYVRGDRPAPRRVSSERQTQYSWDRARAAHPRAETSPDVRARPYPSPRPRVPRGLPMEVEAPSDDEGAEQDDDDAPDGEGQCDVPGCGCGARTKGVGTPRLRPAFRDMQQSVAGWTVLEGASEDV